MLKKIIAIILILTLSVPLLHISGIILSSSAANGADALEFAVREAKPLLYKGYGEQSRKYLADKIARAEGILLSELTTASEYEQTLAELKNATDNLRGMHAFECIQLNGIATWRDDDIKDMKESIGILSLDESNKPETSAFSVKVTATEGAVLSNGNGNGSVVGNTPFGKDMLKADGIFFWVSVDEYSVFEISIGTRCDKDILHTAEDVCVTETGYIYVPFENFVASNGGKIPKDGSLNYLEIKNLSDTDFAISDFNAYNEILETGNGTEYTETLINSRGDIESLAYYKLIEVSTGKAVTLVTSGTDLYLEDGAVTFALEENLPGNAAQMWQLAESPSGNGSFRIINKTNSNALEIDQQSKALKGRAVDFTKTNQEWALSANKNEFSIQVRGVGKLTAAGNTVKTTTTNTVKKFRLYKVEEVEYEEFWADEFNGEELDRSKWFVNDGHYAGGGIATIHVDDDDLIDFKDGKMLLTADVSRSGGYDSRGIYMSTAGKFAMSYGKIEIRAKLAYGNGQFPAFWLMPVDLMNMGAGEIDIMEMTCKNNTDDSAIQIGTIHWTSDDGYNHMSKVHHLKIHGYGEGKYLSDDFHTYGVEMDREQIRYYFDGVQFNSLRIDTLGKKFAFGDMARFIVLNNSLQGTGSAMIDWSYGMLDKYVTEIDYVRCYIDSAEMSPDFYDYPDEGNIIHSTGIDAVASNEFFETALAIAISPDGSQGIAAEDGGNIYIFDPYTNETKKFFSIYPVQHSYRIVYSTDSSKVAIATNRGCIVIYDTADFDKDPVEIYNGAVIQESILFSADSSQLIVGGFNGGSGAYQNPIDGGRTEKWCFRVFDVATGEKLQEIHVGSDPRDIVISDDGTKVAVSTATNGIFVYNTLDWSEYAHFSEGHKYVIRSSDFTSDSKFLVTSDEEGVINVWDLEEKELKIKINNVNKSSVRKVMFSPDDSRILASSNYGAARLFDVESGELVSLFGSFEAAVREAKYSPDGKYIVASSYDGTTKLFDSNGTFLSLLETDDVSSRGSIISTIEFTPDSSSVYIALRTTPNFIHKWALPKEIDKSALNEAIALATPGSKEYDFAVQVSKMKYAPADVVSLAYGSLKKSISSSPFSVSASVDGNNYGLNKLDIMKNGYVYLKALLPVSADAPYVTLNNTVLGVIKTIDITEDNIIKREVASDYSGVTYELKIKLSDAGIYNLLVGDHIFGDIGSFIKVNVDEEKVTTDDFLYSVNEGEVTIDACISGEAYVEIPDYIEGYPVTKIAPYAFNNYGKCIPGMQVKLPSTLKEIGAYAFYGCASLRRIELPEGLEIIGDYAFFDCRLLDCVRFPSTVTTIGNSAIEKTGMGTLYLDADVKFGSKCFSSNFRIREVIIAKGITTLTTNFTQQNHIEALYIPETVTSINSTLFYGNYNPVKLYGVPGSYAEEYANASPSKYIFVPIAAPIISGIEDGKTYDLYTEAAPSLTWDHGHIAYLNGERYVAGKPITTPGEYTLTVVNGYDEYSTTVKFTVVDTTPPPYTLGDMDNDGEISVADALAILRIVAKLAVPEGEQNLIADINKDGVIAVDDALAVLRYVAKLTNEL